MVVVVVVGFHSIFWNLVEAVEKKEKGEDSLHNSTCCLKISILDHL
tara:strand:- start:461 stop:598 length:138 start_codon:yes stop_codon:yes gene_type:complete